MLCNSKHSTCTYKNKIRKNYPYFFVYFILTLGLAPIPFEQNESRFRKRAHLYTIRPVNTMVCAKNPHEFNIMGVFIYVKFCVAKLKIRFAHVEKNHHQFTKLFGFSSSKMTFLNTQSAYFFRLSSDTIHGYFVSKI